MKLFKIKIIQIVVIVLYIVGFDYLYGYLLDFLLKNVQSFDKVYLISILFFIIYLVPPSIYLYKREKIKSKWINYKSFINSLLLILLIGGITLSYKYVILDLNISLIHIDFGQTFIMLIGGYLLVALMAEFVYRFIFIELLLDLKLMNSKYIILISSLLTIIPHYSNYLLMVSTFFVSLILSINYMKNRSFIEVFLLHAIYNIIFGIILCK